MTAALLHRFTREDYYRMAENGTLAPDARVELLNGQIVHMFPLGPRHNLTVYWLTQQLSAASRGRWVVSAQCSVNLSEYYEPEPDFALLRPPMSRYRAAIPVAEDVFLLIEVSDSSLLLDREDKLPAYAAAGIPECWIVNTKDRTVEVYRTPRADGYAQQTIAHLGETCSPLAFPDVVLSVTDLFDAR